MCKNTQITVFIPPKHKYFNQTSHIDFVLINLNLIYKSKVKISPKNLVVSTHVALLNLTTNYAPTNLLNSVMLASTIKQY